MIAVVDNGMDWSAHEIEFYDLGTGELPPPLVIKQHFEAKWHGCTVIALVESVESWWEGGLQPSPFTVWITYHACPRCDGSGYLTPQLPCPECLGWGVTDLRECPHCKGSGRREPVKYALPESQMKCYWCEGRGQLPIVPAEPEPGEP